jgi:hypothetical protein
MLRATFPSPTNIRRQTPHEIYGADARYLLNNLSKEFERQARKGQEKQSIEIKRKGTCGQEAVWIGVHAKHADQREYTTDFCNSELASTGWQIVGFDFKEVPRYQWYGGETMPTMTAIIVKMEYACDDVRAS